MQRRRSAIFGTVYNFKQPSLFTDESWLPHTDTHAHMHAHTHTDTSFYYVHVFIYSLIMSVNSLIASKLR